MRWAMEAQGLDPPPGGALGRLPARIRRREVVAVGRGGGGR